VEYFIYNVVLSHAENKLFCGQIYIFY
jgi:hypothetical protein